MDFYKIAAKKIILYIQLSVYLFIASACTNDNSAPRLVATDTNTRSFIGGTSQNTPGSNTVDALNLVRVVRSNQDPTNLIDAIGENAEIGSFCATPTDCRCVFVWTESTGIRRELEVTPSYSEANLLRCSTADVTTQDGYFDVRIKLVSSDQYSNTQRIFISSATPALDASQASNFLPVYRYMCRDVIDKRITTTKYQDTLLDPAVWNKGHIYTFYTTSLGQDYGAVGSNVRGYECPVIPNNAAENSIYDMRIRSQEPVNLNAPSDLGTTVIGGDNTIYPNTDSQNITPGTCPTGREAGCEKYRLNRHDFYLANFRSGAFREPVCMLHKVENITTGTLRCTVPTTATGAVTIGSSALANGGQDIIGFAAIPNSNEDCPDETVTRIPSNMKWAKIWQFRRSREPRSFDDIANPSAIGDLFCTTRNRECRATTSNGVDVRTVCHNATGTNSSGFLGAQVGATLGGSWTDPGFGNCNQNGSTGDQYPPSTGYIASAACVAGGVNCCRDVNPLDTSGVPLATNRPANFAPDGTGNWCTPSLIGAVNSSTSTDRGLAEDVWLMGLNGSRRACIEADTDSNGRLNSTFATLPQNNLFTITQRPIDRDPTTDILYVVTPASVKMEQMANPDSPIAKKFKPYRCLDESCSEPQYYELTVGSLNTNTYLDRLSRFPLCVLQDKVAGARDINP